MTKAVVAVLALLALGGTLRAQAPVSAPAFEVASVKPNTSGEGGIRLGLQPGGAFIATNATLRVLVAAAYGTPQPLPNSRIVGGPAWMDSDRFDIVARTGSGQGPETPFEEVLLMTRSLLIERFKLVAHMETRDQPVYELVLARSDGKLGPQLKRSNVDCTTVLAGARGAAPPPPQPGEIPVCRMFGGNGHVAGGTIVMAQLVANLSVRVNRPVVDKTGLTGTFDVDLAWTPDQIFQAPPGAPGIPPVDPNGPSIFTALQEQLGLKLESQKAPVGVLVIDSVDHPTED